MEEIKINKIKIKEDVDTKLRQAGGSSNFWDSWHGTPEGALVHLTDDIYSYKAKHNKYGEGIAIKYGDKNFWCSPNSNFLVNSANTRITSEELRASGNEVLAEQINRLIGLSLEKMK